jgi:cellulose synthase/poly-beta-1,6-N-acetylglucosamine synthase-like glycosyltransferase
MINHPFKQNKIMRRFSKLAGPVIKLDRKKDFKISYVSIINKDRNFYKYWARILAYGALLITITFAIVLFQPKHWIILQYPESSTFIGNWIMLFCLVFLQLFAIIGTISATRSTLKAKDPVPVRPKPGFRVAFATTRAPGEPVDLVENTLKAAKRVSYKGGTVDYWLLDETNDKQLQKICRSLGVHYFTRSGKKKWNMVKPNIALLYRIMPKLNRNKTLKSLDYNPFFAAKSKHGNFNSWMSYIESRGINYDILAGVDTDQVPEPNYLERLLGYFWDDNVAYVVGPQVYGNYTQGLGGLVARWAESQASFFQSTVQRAGNYSESAMFVGTNYAVRMKALQQIGGFQPCITEDMATGLVLHAHKNPETGKQWKSVYTPDVLALGEGPSFWGPYFTQQWRWAAGTFDTWYKVVWRVFYKLPAKTRMHYFLMLTFYPMSALTWLLAVISSMTYLFTGSTAILAPWGQFTSLYLMTLVMQLSLYFWNRQHNVSPHEQQGTYGVPGMALSSLTAPIYLSAFFGNLIGRKAHFVVTTKGNSDNPDWIQTFRTHLGWGIMLLIGVVYGLTHHHSHPAMLLWAGILIVISFTPFILGMSVAIPERINKRARANQLTTEEI